MKWTEERRKIAAQYDDHFAKLPTVRTPRIAANRTHVYHLYVIRVENRDALQHHLNESGIATMLNYSKALPYYPAYGRLGHTPADFPNAYHNQSRILSIPIYPEMTDEMVAHVVDSVSRAIGLCA